jgi:hypothetical protein
VREIADSMLKELGDAGARSLLNGRIGGKDEAAAFRRR